MELVVVRIGVLRLEIEEFISEFGIDYKRVHLHVAGTPLENQCFHGPPLASPSKGSC
jgi:hypothetical protein